LMYVPWRKAAEMGTAHL